MSNNKPHPNYTAQQLKNLSLEELLDGIDPNALQKKALKPKSTLDLRSKERREAEEAEAEAAHQRRVARKITPWLLECAVLVEVRTTCQCCQAQYISPAAESLLVRMRNKRDNSVWEVANHPCQINPGLPRERRLLEATVHACAQCFETPSSSSHYQDWSLASPREE